MMPTHDLDAFCLDRQREMLEPKRTDKLVTTMAVTDRSIARDGARALARQLAGIARAAFRRLPAIGGKLAGTRKRSRPATP